MFEKNSLEDIALDHVHETDPKPDPVSPREVTETRLQDGITERIIRNDKGDLITEYLKDGILVERRELLPSGDTRTTLFDDNGAEYLKARITYADGIAKLTEAKLLPNLVAEIHGYTLRTNDQGRVIESSENTEDSLRAMERTEGAGILDSAATYITECLFKEIPPDSVVVHMAENAVKLGMARFGESLINKAVETVVTGKVDSTESGDVSPDHQGKIDDPAAVLGEVVKYAGIGAKVGEKIGKAVSDPAGILPGKVVGAVVGGVVGYVAAVEGVDFAQGADSEAINEFVDHVGEMANKTVEAIKTAVPEAYETAKSAMNEFLGHFSRTVNA